MTTERWFSQDITQPIVVQHCEGVVFTADNNGNIIGVKLFDGGIPISPGGTATCNVIRPDGVTVSFDGTVSGNMISATLPVTALTVPGVIGIVLQSISGSVVTTVFKGQFTCELTTTETVVAPSVPTSSLAQLTQDVVDLQNGKVNRAGDTMTGNLRIASQNWPSYELSRNDGSMLGVLYADSSDNKLALRAWNTAGTYYNDFRLPDTQAVTGNATYDILTSKSPVTVAQGGTGDTGIVAGTLENVNSNVTVQSETRLRRWGRVVSFSFHITLSANLAAYTPLFYFPTGFRSSDVYNTFLRSAASDTDAAIYKAYTYSGGGYICRAALPAGSYLGELTMLI